LKAVVFAGPSVFRLDRDRPFLAEMRPPAVCGDILGACAEDVQLIGLIDGCFEHCPAVWHKEILAAIAKGVSVFGAASMGALRAAECSAFGMIGVGQIFHDYSSGLRQSDADVAVLHTPGEFGYEPLTEALVNVEATIAALRADGTITASEASALITAAHALHFKDRTWESMLRLCACSKDRTATVLERSALLYVDQKAADAALLIDAITYWCRLDSMQQRPSFNDFNRTVYLRNLERRLAGVCRRAAA
jgi:hypothetical protein